MRNAVFILVGVAALALAGFLWFDANAPARPCFEQSFEGSRFTVCPFRAAEHELQLAWADGRGAALGGFAALAGSGLVDPARVRFAMNAGMFDSAGAPVGLFVANGQEQRPLNQQNGSGNFYLQPNGVFFVDARHQVFIRTTADFAAGGAAPNWATQSGPMLVVAGALTAAFDHDGTSRNTRNGVGVQSPGLAFFVISEEPVSFGKFARLFRDVLKCGDALHLDGAVSSLWEPALGRRDDAYALGPLVVVSDRAKGVEQN